METHMNENRDQRGELYVFVATVAFSGDAPEVNVDSAVAELRRAGYQITRLPDELRACLVIPGDDFIEAVFDGPDDDDGDGGGFKKINALVDKYAGNCVECGPMWEDHVPFTWFERPKLDT
jgi:hypothetical protein